MDKVVASIAMTLKLCPERHLLRRVARKRRVDGMHPIVADVRHLKQAEYERFRCWALPSNAELARERNVRLGLSAHRVRIPL